MQKNTLLTRNWELSLCNLGSIRGHFLGVWGWFCWVLFSHIMPSKAGYRVQPQPKNCPRITKQRADIPYEYQILKATVLSLSSFPLVIGNAMQVWFEKNFKSFRFWAIWRALRSRDGYAWHGERLADPQHIANGYDIALSSTRRSKSVDSTLLGDKMRPGQVIRRPCDFTSGNLNKTSVREKSRGVYLAIGWVFPSYSMIFSLC